MDDKERSAEGEVPRMSVALVQRRLNLLLPALTAAIAGLWQGAMLLTSVRAVRSEMESDDFYADLIQGYVARAEEASKFAEEGVEVDNEALRLLGQGRE